MNKGKLKLSEFHKSKVWYWCCPECEYFNEENSNPLFFEGFDEESAEYFECVGCYEIFDLDKGE